MEDVNLELLEARHSLHKTQKAMAEFIGAPLDTWKQWESGRRTPPEYVTNMILERTKRELSTREGQAFYRVYPLNDMATADFIDYSSAANYAAGLDCDYLIRKEVRT